VLCRTGIGNSNCLSIGRKPLILVCLLVCEWCWRGWGVDRAEPLLRQMCDCTMLGTDALNAVDAARQLGFPLAHKENLTITQLTNVLQSGCFPIVYVNLLLIEAVAGIHAMVVIAADDRYVQVYDPLVGERQLEKMMFDAAWGMTNRLTILIPGQELATD
jgi:ABC-type bacteriocin/lantibiotic exporter with double-glycine peptidase domain